MSVFVKVADLGSFSAAAKELRLSPTMIGKHMRHLEGRLGSLLINRSTRRQSLTELNNAEERVTLMKFRNVAILISTAVR